VRTVSGSSPILKLEATSITTSEGDKVRKKEMIFKSKLVTSIRNATANLTKIREYEAEDMKNQNPKGVF
jgi:hypothetical protein